MAIGKVTKERFSRKDNFRAQINVDQRIVAYGYNVLVDFMGPKAAEHLRNKLKEQYEKEIKDTIRLLLKDKEREGFQASVRHYMAERVDKDLWDEMKKFYFNLGWPNGK